MPELISKAKTFWFETLWRLDAAGLKQPRRMLVHALRIVWVIGRDILDGQLTLRAMSLVYTTLLSLVPLLAVSFSVLKAFGVHNQIEPMLRNLLLPLGEQGLEITEQIIEFVDNIQVGVLGIFGVALLLYTVIAMVQKIESACNEIWHVKQTRPLTRRFSDYLSVILVGPVLMFSAVGITATFANSDVVQYVIAIQPFGVLLELIGRVIPYLLVIGAFIFIYIFVPNTRVRVRPAMIGAVVAGVLWATLGWAFTAFVASSGKYTAIYSAFATLILFMIWIYLGWLILLIGAKVAFYIQHPKFISKERGPIHLSNQQSEALGLAVMQCIARAFDAGDSPPDVDTLSRRLAAPQDAIDRVLSPLIDAELVRCATEPVTGLQPARPLNKISLDAVIQTVRMSGADGRFKTSGKTQSELVELLERLEDARKHALKNVTVQDLV